MLANIILANFLAFNPPCHTLHHNTPVGSRGLQGSIKLSCSVNNTNVHQDMHKLCKSHYDFLIIKIIIIAGSYFFPLKLSSVVNIQLTDGAEICLSG